MPNYKKCEPEIYKLAKQILEKHESHKPLLENKVTIDLCWAFGEKDDHGIIISPAIMKVGRRCYGITRKLSLKDRSMGRGDAEIVLDYDYWSEAQGDVREALLDHELHHIAFRNKWDTLSRPLLRLRQHDVEVGWFNIVAARHGKSSIEQIQAESIMNEYGQYYWPSIVQGKTEGKRFMHVAQSVK